MGHLLGAGQGVGVAIYSVDNLYIAEAHDLDDDGRQLLRVRADARVLFEVFIFKSVAPQSGGVLTYTLDAGE